MVTGDVEPLGLVEGEAEGPSEQKSQQGKYVRAQSQTWMTSLPISLALA